MPRYYVAAVTELGQQFTVVVDLTGKDIDDCINEAANTAALEIDGTYGEVIDYELVTEH